MPKCPICRKNYRKGNYINHIWSAHKRMTIAYLAKKRKSSVKKKGKAKKKGKYCSECGQRLE